MRLATFCRNTEELMRFKNLLGLAAIVGAAAYAHKQRGGDLSLEGIKGSLDNLVGNVKSRLGQRGGGQRMGATGQQGQPDQSIGASNVSDTFGTDDFGTASSADTGSVGSNDSTRRY